MKARGSKFSLVPSGPCHPSFWAGGQQWRAQACRTWGCTGPYRGAPREPRGGCTRPHSAWLPKRRVAAWIHQTCCWSSKDLPQAGPICPQATDNPTASGLFAQRLNALREKDGFGTVLFSSHVRKVRSGAGELQPSPAQGGGFGSCQLHPSP